MDYEALVNEILRRVMAKLQEMEAAKAAAQTPAATSSQCSATQCCPAATATSPKELRITKRVLTERDVIDATREGITCIIVGERTILTDLAKERAANSGINIVKN